jgi:hypothetical protein
MEQASDVKAKRCGDRRVKQDLLASLHTLTLVHTGVCARHAPAHPWTPHIRLHDLPVRAAQECPDGDMRRERFSDRHATVDACRERYGLDDRVLVSDAGVVVDARDPEVLAKSK